MHGWTYGLNTEYFQTCYKKISIKRACRTEGNFLTQVSKRRFEQWNSLLFQLLRFLRSSHRQLWLNLFHKPELQLAHHKLSIVSLLYLKSLDLLCWLVIFEGGGPCVSWNTIKSVTVTSSRRILTVLVSISRDYNVGGIRLVFHINNSRTWFFFKGPIGWRCCGPISEEFGGT